MRKKTCIYGAIGIGALVIIAGALFAVFNCWKYYDTDGHRYGGKHPSYMMSEKRLNQLSRKLELDDAQRAALFTTAEPVRPAMQGMHEQMRAARRALFELDPKAEGYDAKVAELAEQHSELARHMTILIGQTKAKLGETFSEAQMQKFMRILKRRHGH